MDHTKSYGLNLIEGADRLYPAPINENTEALERMLSKLEGRDWKVGDIRETTRAGLDDTWALCNGADFDPAEYPVLAEHGPELSALGQLRAYIPKETVGNYESSTNYAFASVHGAEGWLAVASGGFLHATRDSFQTVTTVKWTDLLGISQTVILDEAVLRYVDGRWYLAGWFGAYLGSTSGTYYIVCNDGPDPTTGWGTPVNIGAASGGLGMAYLTGKVLDIWKEGERYWLAATVAGVPKLVYSDAHTFEGFNILTPTTEKVGTSDWMCGFLRTGDKHVFYGNSHTVCYADAGDTLYTVKTYSMGDTLSDAGLYEWLNASSSYSYRTTSNMVCINGRYCRVGVTHSNPLQLFLYYTDDLAADQWTVLLTGLSWNASGFDHTALSRCLVYVPERGGCVTPLPYCVTGNGAQESYQKQGGLLFFKDPFGEGEILRGSTYVAEDTAVTYEMASRYAPSILHEGGIWIPGTSGLVRIPVYALPREGSDYGYKYIKVKEDDAL